MIVKLKQGAADELINKAADTHMGIRVQENGSTLLVLPSKLKELPPDMDEISDEVFVTSTDIQLAGKEYRQDLREVKLGEVTIGGATNNTVMIGGPCSVENEDQIRSSALLMKKLGVKVLRAGSYKPRTSPYSFQGLGLEGLKLLSKMRDEFGCAIITEVRDASHVDDVIEHADIIQIGAKSMYDHGILRKCGKTQKPVLLKRGFGTTLQEFVQASEFILSGGNPNVMLCERGIRTFETKTRFTLDLCGVEFIKEHTNLPVVLDPSHAMGYAYGVPNLARACVAVGCDGLLIEVHPTPKQALSDAAQQLNHQEFEELLQTLRNIATAVGRQIV